MHVSHLKEYESAIKADYGLIARPFAKSMIRRNAIKKRARRRVIIHKTLDKKAG